MAVLPESSKRFKKENLVAKDIKGNLENGDVVIRVNPDASNWDGEIVFAKSATPDGSVRTARFKHIAFPAQIRRKRTKWALKLIKDIRVKMKITPVEPDEWDVKDMASYLFKTTDMNPVTAGLTARIIVSTIGAVPI